jgi:hypothetical protein
MAVGDDEDVVKEIHDATVPRVDAVKGPAHGMPFLILKAEGDQEDAAGLAPDAALDAAQEGAAGLPVPTDAPGDPTDPGSPAWEAVDAAKARSATATIVALKTLVGELAARESAEASAGLFDGDSNAWDLDDVNCALDYALGVLAPYAVKEQAEADQVAQDIEDAARGLGLIKAAERLVDLLDSTPVRKAGRVLSATNEAALRSAAEAISNVLATLPAAAAGTPAEEAQVTKSDTPVVKDDTAPAPEAPGEAQPVETPGDGAPEAADQTSADDAAGAPVAKAGKPQVAVYDADGKLVGTIDQADLNPIASATPPDGGDADAPAAADDLAPAPAAAAGVPAEAAPAAAAPAAVAKSTTDEGAPDNETDMVPVSVVKALEDRLAALEAPARSKVVSNGHVPPPHLMRGQDKGAAPDTDIAKSDDLRKQLERSTDVAERERLTAEMNQQAADALARLRSRT